MDTFTAFPDFKIETKSFFTSDDHVCIEAVMSGTHMGNFPGLPPATVKSFSVRGAHICELRGGKAMRVTDYYDGASLMRQLGLLPSPPGAIIIGFTEKECDALQVARSVNRGTLVTTKGPTNPCTRTGTLLCSVPAGEGYVSQPEQDRAPPVRSAM